VYNLKKMEPQTMKKENINNNYLNSTKNTSNLGTHTTISPTPNQIYSHSINSVGIKKSGARPRHKIITNTMHIRMCQIGSGSRVTEALATSHLAYLFPGSVKTRQGNHPSNSSNLSILKIYEWAAINFPNEQWSRLNIFPT
jgi:hypothetical protein